MPTDVGNAISQGSLVTAMINVTSMKTAVSIIIPNANVSSHITLFMGQTNGSPFGEL